MTAIAPRSERVAAEVRASVSRVGARQKDLARVLGISSASASELWNGRVPYSIDRLDTIARWLGVRITDLLGGDSPPRTDPREARPTIL